MTEWWFKNGIAHRDNDKPGLVCPSMMNDGTKWFKVIYENGIKIKANWYYEDGSVYYHSTQTKKVENTLNEQAN